MKKFSFTQKFAKFSDYWTPKIVGETNGQYVKVAKAKGDMVWHSHADEDELFLVFEGELTIHFRDHVEVLGPGECLIVPKGVEHKTSAQRETHFVMIEPKTTAHTGEVDSTQTVELERQEWI